MEVYRETPFFTAIPTTKDAPVREDVGEPASGEVSQVPVEKGDQPHNQESAVRRQDAGIGGRGRRGQHPWSVFLPRFHCFTTPVVRVDGSNQRWG